MAPTLPEAMEVPPSSIAAESFVMLACCRKFLNGTPLSYAVVLERSAIQTNKALYFVCQAASYSTVYMINILDGRLECHDKTPTPHCNLEIFMCDDEDNMMNRALPWHFVCESTSIYAVPYIENEIYACGLHQGTLSLVPARRPTGDGFSIAHVVQVGHKIIAASDTLQGIYHLSHTHEWKRCSTYAIHGLERKVNLSGYVVLTDESFIVSDADSNRCFLLDLRDNTWRIVTPYVEFTRSLRHQTERLPSCWPGRAFRSERSLFAKGFIYTCSSAGLTAYELIEEGDSYYLGNGIDLQFLWRKYWECNPMCLDYIGEDTSSGAIMFCVVQDDYVCGPGYPDNHLPVCISTVQVKTEETPNGKLRPKTIGRADIGTSSVEWNERQCGPEVALQLTLDF